MPNNKRRRSARSKAAARGHDSDSDSDVSMENNVCSSPFAIPSGLPPELSQLLRDAHLSTSFGEPEQGNNTQRSEGHPVDLEEVIPRLLVIRQTSAGEEKFAKNGVHKNVHVVVKNTPFLLQLGLSRRTRGNEVLDFNRMGIEATLLYDSDEMKEVDYVSAKPVSYKAHIGDRSDQVTIETRIKVLSSQLEGMHFRVRLQAVDSLSQEDIPGMSAITQPIKVVSKPEQVGRKKPPANGPRTTKKRNMTQDMLDSLARLEKGQQEQRRLLEALRSGEELAEGKEKPLKNSNCASPKLKGHLVVEELGVGSTPAERFTNSFANCLKSFNEMSEDDSSRPVAIRRLVQQCNSSEVESMMQMINMLNYELGKDGRSMSSLASSGVASSFAGLDASPSTSDIMGGIASLGMVGTLSSDTQSSFNFAPFESFDTDIPSAPFSMDHPSQQRDLEKINEYYKEFLSMAE